MGHSCRFCARPLRHVVVDLGVSPLANSYLRREDLDKPEPFYPLRPMLCEGCFLVQLPEVAPPESIFTDYAYFSSYSSSWVRHAERYAEAVIERFGLGAGHQVIEIASNDGYLLRHFRDRGVPVLGIEPARNVAAAAQEAGIPTLVEFFGVELARRLAAEGRRADLLVANNVLAHTPRLNDFVAGIAAVLAAARRRDPRVPPSRAADRREPVRHHLSRALLVLLVHHRRRGLRRATASSCSTSRSCRPTADRCASTRGAPDPASRPGPASGELLRARARAGSRHARLLPRLRRAGRGEQAARSSSS